MVELVLGALWIMTDESYILTEYVHMPMNPFTFVLFGATGDLAQKKIFPALQSFSGRGGFSGDSRIIAFSRRRWSDQEYRQFIAPSLSLQGDASGFLERITYAEGTFDNPESYRNLKERIKTDTVLYYFAVQPEFYTVIASGLAAAGLNVPGSRILIEKPFGHDAASSEALERELEKHFAEGQLFRIDHYLGKGGVDDLASLLKPDTARSISAQLFETIDIQGRGEFYDAVGAFKDVGQNHVLEMLAFLLQPLAGSRAAALRSLSTEAIDVRVRGQYEGYAKEPEVNPSSDTETYFSVATESSLLPGVPITLEGGKATDSKYAGITITHVTGAQSAVEVRDGARSAYEVIIEQAIAGNKDHFVSSEEVAASWDFADAVAEKMENVPLSIYKKGTRP